jgi:hypothetical protein
MNGRSYVISADGRSITCRRCGMTSHHGEDVRQRYCPRCHIFHEFIANSVREFDCGECGRHITVIAGPMMSVCAMCQTMPGWWHDPEAARLLDPNHIRNPKPTQ